MVWPGGPCPTSGELASWVVDARRATLALVEDLDDAQMLGPKLSILNPFLWEIGHIGWFQEKWILRHAGGAAPLRSDADALYDSSAVPHDTRWDLPLPSRESTLDYLTAVRDRVLERLERGSLGETEVYFVCLAVFHEDMHTEAFAYTRQTLELPRPAALEALAPPSSPATPAVDAPLGDAEVPGGRFRLGAEAGSGFVFDNEKWAHEVEVRPFAIARTAVTQGQLADFVGDGGYRRAELWSPAGWAWRVAAGAELPLYWRRREGTLQRRDFDRWVDLEPNRPALHVGWFEAEAYCRWAGRRLPTELEWEVAAAGEPAAGGLGERKRRYPWGNDPSRAGHARLDWAGLGAADVIGSAEEESAFGCRQMLGNVWEWTASPFGPYPGFVADPYEDYSRPWFGGGYRVLRGGAWTTRSRLLRNTWRNFYKPDRRDVWAGFRTCRL